MRDLLLVAAIGVLVLSAPRVQAAASGLMPQPASPAIAGQGRLQYEGAFDVRWKGDRGPVLDAAVARFARDMRTLSGIDRWPDTGIPLAIDCCAPGMSTAALHAQDEGYTLTVAAGGIDVRARSELGVLRALATLRQMLQGHDGGWSLPAATIRDRPRFPWRGVMVDTARHFMTLETLKRQIDAMEQVKLNVLHLHLSDNEGFRVESLAFPKLTAGEHGQYYTQAQVRELVAYAAERGVRVVPEFDVPGHAGAIVRAYPQYGSADTPASRFGAVLDPSNPDTYAFLETLFGEMAALFPDPYFHAGGDEVGGEDWASNPRIQAYMAAHGLEDKEALQGHFMTRVHGIVDGLGKAMIGWEEIVHGDIPRSTYIQAWTSSNFVHTATQAGHPVVVSAGYYLDYLEPAEVYYLRDPTDAAAAGIEPAIHAKVKAIDRPALSAVFPESQVIQPGLALSDAQKALVRGAEAPLWSELVTDELLDSRLWPRLAALAERFWSPESVRDVDDMNRRLVLLDGQLDRLGLQARGNRRRMAERLAPGDAEVVAALADITAPVRNFAHMHSMHAYIRKQPIPVQQFTAPADIATPSNPVALAFNLEAARFAAGERGLGATLAARMQGWKANDARYRVVAAGRPALEAALPASAATARLADIGLAAIAHLGADTRPDAAWLADARAHIAELHAQAQASSSLFASIVSPQQPPADLIIAVVTGVERLLDAAEGQ
ncbi:beta-N-acetylhexosaminidase [Pseudoxanthomonas suwonensis]|uniref:beta-N-acetylhexosaminidase n=1 Tax=Pseudoxanthomonas suwonensis TaxID=314722 RepID=UPI00069694AC|nr:family 20 glycosylhydrolase [Pseudoxanthomonas suwonensis]